MSPEPTCRKPPTHSTSLILWKPPTSWESYMGDFYIPLSLSGRNAAQTTCFQLTEPHTIHSSIWSKVWKETATWPSYAKSLGLNLALVGDGLRILAKNLNSPAYLALVTGDMSGDIRFRKAELLSSLQPHDCNERGEIVFRESKVVLNIDDALYSPEIITLATEKLFTCPNSGFQSACLYWEDREHAIRFIGSENIIGFGERKSTMEDVKWICDITLPRPSGRLLEHIQRQTFQQSNRPKVRPIFEPSRGGSLIGWEAGDY